LDDSFSYGLKSCVALNASSEDILKRIQTAGLNHLFELLAKLIAVDQEVLRGTLLGNASIPRKDHPAFAACRPDQAITR